MNRKSVTIVLVNPNNDGNYIQSAFQREHLGLGYLAAELQEHDYVVHIIDSRIEGDTPEMAAKKILQRKACVVGFSIIAKTAADWCEKVSKLVKKARPDIHITIGNYFPSLQPKRAFFSMPSIDSIIMCEGDISFPNLVDKISSGKNWHKVTGIAYKTTKSVHINPPECLVSDLDKLSFPVHTAQRYGIKEFAIEGSRGCFRRCCFCSIGAFFDLQNGYSLWRARSPKNIAMEIKENLKSFPNITKFRFVDADFVGGTGEKYIKRLKDIVKEFCKINEKFEFIIDTRTRVINDIPRSLWADLKRAGLNEVFLGIETASPSIKKLFEKDSSFEEDLKAVKIMEELGVRVRYGFMMITPWSNEDSIIKNAEGLHHLAFPRLDKYFQEMYVVPGTKSVELTKKVTNIWFDHHGNGEYYTYGLSSPIDQLRRIGRSLIDNNLAFMSKHQSIHERIRKKLESKRAKDVLKYRDMLNDFSYDFFKAVFICAKRLDPKVSDKKITYLIKQIINSYQPRLDNIEKNFNLFDK